MGIPVQTNTSERKHIQNASGNPRIVKSNPAGRKHIQKSSGNPGTNKHSSTQAYSEFKWESWHVKDERIAEPAERKHTQNSSTNLGKIKHIECNYIQT